MVVDPIHSGRPISGVCLSGRGERQEEDWCAGTGEMPSARSCGQGAVSANLLAARRGVCHCSVGAGVWAGGRSLFGYEAPVRVVASECAHMAACQMADLLSRGAYAACPGEA